MPLQRMEGWESRLAAVMQSARSQTYALGEWDCFALACAAVNALTGVDFWPAWRGRYHTPREALRLLAEFGGGFTGSFTRLFGVAPGSIKLARRGDIAEIRDSVGQSHLGVVLGSEVVVAMQDVQLQYAPRSLCRHAWSIG